MPDITTASRLREQAEAALIEAEKTRAAAHEALLEAIAVAEKAEAEDPALKAEREAAEKAAQANERRHLADREKARNELVARTKANEVAAPETIKVVTVDKAVHEVSSHAPLKLGHRGIGDACREGSRFGTRCNLSIDTPNDEIAALRFQQGKKVDCPGCIQAKAAAAATGPT